jgi:hypothetical protein
MSKISSSSSSGISFIGLLTVLFIALKLMGYIDWSWVWVLAPLWGGFAITFVVLAIMYLVFVYMNKTTEN